MEVPLRIALIGFPSLMRQWLRYELETLKNVLLVYSPGSGEFSIDEMKQHAPDCCVYRVNQVRELPGLQQVIRQHTGIPGLAWWNGKALSDHEVLQLLEAGFRGILDDRHDPSDLSTAVRDLMQTGMHLNDVAGRALFHVFNKRIAVNGGLPAFSDREKKAIALRKNGKTSKEIGEKLCLSKKTIDKLFYQLYRKFGTQNFFSLLDQLENSGNMVHLQEAFIELNEHRPQNP